MSESEGSYLLEKSLLQSALGEDDDYDVVKWARKSPGGYEVSSIGDKRFSAFNAIMPDGRSIEHWYQCDIKGHDQGGTNWRAGKGKSPIFPYPNDQLWELYLNVWRLWAIRHGNLLLELANKVQEHGYILTDCFASTDINQARALAQILNEWIFNE